MASNFALRTFSLVLLWLFSQNFNASTLYGQPSNQASGKSTYKIRKVVLDAGHGGKDPGCMGVTSTKEKDNTLAIILALGALLEANYPDIEVIYTRSTDVFIELNERAAIANRNNADLFISVHCNSMSVSSVAGTETYVMGLHTAEHNLEVAKRENASIYMEKDYEKNYDGYDPNSPTAHILGSVWQSAYLEQSILLASLVQQHAAVIGGRNNKGVKQAGFLVLRETAMPAILVESGYMTNAAEESFLLSEEGRNQIAASIFAAFEGYKSQMEGHTVAHKQPVKTIQAKPAKVAPAATASAKTPPAKTIPTTPPPPVKPTPVPKVVAQNTNNQPVAQKIPTTIPAKNVPNTGSFRIQLLSWPVRLDRNVGQMAMLNDVQEEKREGRYYYFVGDYDNRIEAEKILTEIHSLGFKTAKIEGVAAKVP